MLDSLTHSSEKPVLVLGAAGIDMIGRLNDEIIMGTSNPARINANFGGTARNVAENLALLGQPVTFLSIVGEDDRNIVPGYFLLKFFQNGREYPVFGAGTGIISDDDYDLVVLVNSIEKWCTTHRISKTVQDRFRFIFQAGTLPSLKHTSQVFFGNMDSLERFTVREFDFSSLFSHWFTFILSRRRNHLKIRFPDTGR